MSRRKCSKVEDTGSFDQILLNFFFGEHHICARITIERKVTVTIRISMYESECGVAVFIHDKVTGVNADFLNSSL